MNVDVPETNRGELFRFESPYRDPLRNTLFTLMRGPLSKLLCLERLNGLYSEIGVRKRSADYTNFIDEVLGLLKVDCSISEDMRARIPKEGPCVVVSNHPFGVVEGLILIKILRSVRPDVKIMANHMLGLIPEMKEYLIEVDPFGRAQSQKNNIAGLKQSLRWLKGGGMLGVFPAGEVASLQLKKRMVADPAWSPTVGGIIRKAGCPVVPIFFGGRNGKLFQTLGLVHPRLRTVMLPRENLRRINSRVEIRVGTAVPAKKMATFASNDEAIEYLRFRTYLLRQPVEKLAARAAGKACDTPVAPAQDQARMLAEVESLPEKNLLIRSAPFLVFEAAVDRIPTIIKEIGRLREETFRGVGEGTGRELDLDRFDATYRHLVLWNEEKGEIAGAYRFCRTDKIMRREGLSGLYTHTLFKMKPGLIEQISPALELGRSFVRPEYQRSYQPLLLMWKGLAAYVSRHPKYRNLFGCVSVSGDYKALSRELIVKALEKTSFLPELARLIKPKNPPRIKHFKKLDVQVPDSAFKDPEDIGAYVSEIELDKSLPVLLRQYLKLGGKILAFNMDPDFGNCMDGLILVDLTKTGTKVLGRFMGADEARAFEAWHSGDEPEGAAPGENGAA